MSRWPFLDSTLLIAIELLVLYALARSRYCSINALASMAAVSGLLDEFQSQFSFVRGERPKYYILYTLIVANGIAFGTSCVLAMGISAHQAAKTRDALAVAAYIPTVIALAKCIYQGNVSTSKQRCGVLAGIACLAACEFHPQLQVIVLAAAAMWSLTLRPLALNYTLYTHDVCELALFGVLMGMRLLLHLSAHLLRDSPSIRNTETIALGVMSAYTSVMFVQRAFEVQDMAWKWRAFLIPALPLGCLDLILHAVYAVGCGHRPSLDVFDRVQTLTLFNGLRQFCFYGSCGYLGGMLYLQLVEHHQAEILQPMRTRR